jgi:formylglycine-generating enzyme required for sulfatase activity
LKFIGSRRTLLFAAALAVAGGATYFYIQHDQVNSTIPVVVQSDGKNAPLGMVWVPGGEFLMGSDHKKAQANERPVHRVKVNGFWMDSTHVTNDQFSQFVKETNYRTTAEQIPDWETIRVQLPPGTPKPPDSVFVPGAMVFVGSKEKDDDRPRFDATHTHSLSLRKNGLGREREERKKEKKKKTTSRAEIRIFAPFRQT